MGRGAALARALDGTANGKRQHRVAMTEDGDCESAQPEVEFSHSSQLATGFLGNILPNVHLRIAGLQAKQMVRKEETWITWQMMRRGPLPFIFVCSSKYPS